MFFIGLQLLVYYQNVILLGGLRTVLVKQSFNSLGSFWGRVMKKLWEECFPKSQKSRERAKQGKHAQIKGSIGGNAFV